MVFRKRECPICGPFTTIEAPATEFTVTVAGQRKLQQDRDRAIGALGVLMFDGVITEGRLRELMGRRVTARTFEPTKKGQRMNEITYKYFVAEGEAIAPVLKMAKAKSSAHQERISALLEKYDADCLWGGSRSAPFAIGFIWERPDGDYRAKPPMRENFLKPEVERSGDVTYACYKPDQRYKAGKTIKAELNAVGGFSFSDTVCESLKVTHMVFGALDGRQVMCQTTAGQYGDKLVFRIPTGGDRGDTFTAPDGFREIKKSEFIAITEEST